jgi:voltage-gated potassium channel
MEGEAVTKNEQNEKLGFLNLMVLVLSVYVLGALLIDTFFKLQPEVSRLLNLIDDFICVFFLYEFCVRFYRAENKLKFMKWGWVDLLSSIPTLEYFRPGRVLRLFRILRVLRAFRSIKHLLNHVFAKRVKGTFTTVAIFAALMLVFSSIAILQVEDDPNSNIKTAEDALWWSYVTITTVGYGDRYPVTTEGRIIAALLMTTGVGLFGTFTGFIASWFVDERQEEHENEDNNKDT